MLRAIHARLNASLTEAYASLGDPCGDNADLTQQVGAPVTKVEDAERRVKQADQKFRRQAIKYGHQF